VRSCLKAVPETIEIILPTYNGELYLDDFLRSLEGQTFSGWKLLVRDDGSSDQTLGILDAWRQKLGAQKLRIVSNDQGVSLGSAGNFGCLLEESRSRYVMMADQDDIWLPEKINISLNAIKRLENRVGPEKPCLVNTDATVVDSSLKLLHESKWRLSSLHPSRFPWFGRYLLDNTAQGCTMIMNRALVNLVGEIPDHFLYADWYIAIVASAFGHIDSIPISSVLWRRHQANASGVSRVLGELVMALLQPFTVRQKIRRLYDAGLAYARVIRDKYFLLLDQRGRDVLSAFISFGDMGFWAKRKVALRYGFFFTSYRRSIGFFLFM